MNGIKFVHFADVHLGSGNYGPRDAATGLALRIMDFVAAFDAVVDRALAEEVDLAIFAGDAYRSRTPSPTYQREFLARIGRLAAAGVQVVMVTGNHDTPHASGRENTLGVLDTLRVSNVHVMNQMGMATICTRSGEVQIVALPWVVRSNLVSREGRERRIDDLDRMMLDRITTVMASADGGLVAQLRSDVPSILVGHCTVLGGIYGSERSVILGQEMILPLSLVANPVFDYVALGHLHRHQVLNYEPPVVYSGSVERIAFGEEKDHKGFILGAVQAGAAEWEFVRIATRPFVTVEVEAALPDPTADVVQAIQAHDIEGAVVRLIIHVDSECEALLRREAMVEALEPCFHLASSVYDVDRSTRRRLGGSGFDDIAAMGPREMLARYFDLKGIDAERQKVLGEYAHGLMSEGGTS